MLIGFGVFFFFHLFILIMSLLLLNPLKHDIFCIMIYHIGIFIGIYFHIIECLSRIKAFALINSGAISTVKN